MPDPSQLASLFAHAATGLAVTDVRGFVVDANEAFARIVDREPADLLTANLFAWTHPEDAARHDALLQDLLAEKIPGFVIEKRYLRPNGSSVWVRNSVSVLSDDHAEPGHLISICENISDRKHAEQVMEQQEQMASIGRLTSSIIHEINNPLEAVMNLLYLARHAESSDDTTAYLRQAEEELRRASEITAQGLQFPRQSANAVSMNVAELMQSVLVLFKGKVREGRIQVDYRKEDAPELVCFAGEIRQVFVNLIANAIESMSAGGELRIRVRPGSDWRTGEQGVRITIADTGTGISVETRKRMYDAFVTTKGSGGSGLGLWVTANIVRKHQGSIHVRSKKSAKSGGTVFSLIFPYRGAFGRAPGFQVEAA